ncbi:nitroreductase family deazaflavin-dependent oxidoreductase [Agromyces sp. SYSU T00194]|uniref:nitroreductase family deazaflavin-dependent oxidoreductase n=1 Tax=Agromyces chitinivorans TaxID=3158560 RepID=UPI00339174E2
MPIIRDTLRTMIAPVTRTRLFRRWAPAALPPLERAIAWATRGRIQVSALLVPSLVLHTVGARSGLPRETVLMYCPDGNGRAIVAGSNFARGRHPAWTANLLAHPDAEIDVRGTRFAVRATLIGDDERDAVWARIERQWPGYRGYERESGRVVRLFRLQPVAAVPPQAG